MPPHDKLYPDLISKGLNTSRIGSKVIVFGSATSTNDIIAKYADDANNDGLAVFAEEQTQGRGRNGVKWLSSSSDSILCSVLLMNEDSSSDLLSLIAAVAVAETIGEPATIKWPNDILINGKKVAGILLESKSTKAGGAYILGIGINCHQKKFSGELESTATSIYIERGNICDRTILCRRLLIELEGWLEEANNNAAVVIQAWQELSTQLNHRITLIHNKRKFSGTCVGVDPEKGLIVELDRGGRQFFAAAQTSIVK
ncbi:MAG: biotin--[acetyl-CoA-carboxylase] ligase [Sedimentisphaerales bacterium]|nr:biotin--[acetyl-CoA-carboxylase] ligase [Sedimentisphaerales bacterium]